MGLLCKQFCEGSIPFGSTNFCHYWVSLCHYWVIGFPWTLSVPPSFLTLQIKNGRIYLKSWVFCEPYLVFSNSSRLKTEEFILRIRLEVKVTWLITKRKKFHVGRISHIRYHFIWDVRISVDYCSLIRSLGVFDSLTSYHFKNTDATSGINACGVESSGSGGLTTQTKLSTVKQENLREV